jgi:hypothetical protein
VTSDDQVQKGVKAIVKAAKTGKIGDGKVFVLGIQILRARRGLAARWRGIRRGAGPGSLAKRRVQAILRRSISTMEVKTFTKQLSALPLGIGPYRLFQGRLTSLTRSDLQAA